ncbi:MAG: hypothetical protein ACFFD4_37575 [Candidatus Odinarchaeota archaeon]
MKTSQSVRVASNKGAILKLLHPISLEILTTLQENSLNIHQLSTRLCVPKSSIRRYLLELKAENLIEVSYTEKKRGLEVKYYTTRAKLDFPRLNLIAATETSMIGLEALFRETRYFIAGYLLGRNVSMKKINKIITSPAASKADPADKIDYVRRKRRKDTIEEKETEVRKTAINQLRKRYPLIWSVLEEVQRIIEHEDLPPEDLTLSSEQIRLLLIYKATKRILAMSLEDDDIRCTLE